MADAFYKKGEHVLYGVFFAAVILQIFVSISIRPILSFPETVPNVPTLRASQVQFLGDKAFVYRVYGGMIQNFGEYGGKTTALKDYNFERLSRWFFLQNELYVLQYRMFNTCFFKNKNNPPLRKRLGNYFQKMCKNEIITTRDTKKS